MSNSPIWVFEIYLCSSGASFTLGVECQYPIQLTASIVSCLKCNSTWKDTLWRNAWRCDYCSPLSLHDNTRKWLHCHQWVISSSLNCWESRLAWNFPCWPSSSKCRHLKKQVASDFLSLLAGQRRDTLEGVNTIPPVILSLEKVTLVICY